MKPYRAAGGAGYICYAFGEKEKFCDEMQS